jgi:hypothetical protein
MSTGHQFFELKSPRDMLEKARREFNRLQADLNTDNVFNFFVTVHHIKDYAEDYGIPKDQWPKGGDFQTCRKICNMAKHLADSDKKYKDNKFSLESVKLWAEGVWAEGLWDGKEPRFELEGNLLEIPKIAERLINNCDAFLTSRGL